MLWLLMTNINETMFCSQTDSWVYELLKIYKKTRVSLLSQTGVNVIQ